MTASLSSSTWRRQRARVARAGPKGTPPPSAGAKVTLRALRCRRSSDNHLVLSAAHDDDFADLLQSADDADDALLRLFHVSQADGPEILDFFLEHLCSPLRHVLENALGHFLAARLQRESPVPGVHFPDHLLNSPIVQENDVLE